MDPHQIERLPGALIPWYENNKRILPWRSDKEPYHIWLSEIMLQQTRVEAVTDRYKRFLAELPDIASLATCTDERLNKLWEGLGYYSRVRNLKKAARIVLEKYNGCFPASYVNVRALPGIGDYTAGAICSICFGQKVAAVDGNVLRVISRITNDPTPIDIPAYKKQVKHLLEGIYPDDAGTFTQALMELGATVCGPNREPMCGQCPCAAFCSGMVNGTASSLPNKLPKKEKRVEKKTVFIISCGDSYALIKRKESGLLAGLWQFPDTPGWLNTDEALKWVEKSGLKPSEIYKVLEREHVFTHIKWELRGYYLEVKGINDLFEWYTSEQIEQTTALPTAYKVFWNGLN